MRLTLEQKRDIVRAVKDGKEDIYDITGRCRTRNDDWDDQCNFLLKVLRDYINGKFKLESMTRKSEPRKR